MTALSKIVAGSRILASEVQAVAPLAAYKSADQPVTSSTVLVNDNALSVSVLASATYHFQCYLDYEGGTGGSADIKWQWTVPSGAVMHYHAAYQGAGGSANVGNTNTASTSIAARTQGAGTLCGTTMTGTLTVSVTAGTLQLQWAQNTSNGTATIVHAGSSLALWQIA